MKETFNKTTRQLTNWEKIFANDTSGKGLIINCVRNSYNLAPKLPNNQIKKADKGPEWTLFPGGDTDGQQAYEKMLDVTDHHSSVN